MITTGRHICVYGPTGSGKTTLSRQLSERLGVPHIELDAIFWKPGWVEKPVEEFRADVSAALGNAPAAGSAMATTGAKRAT